MEVAHFSSLVPTSRPQYRDPSVVAFTSQAALVRFAIAIEVVVAFVAKRFVEKKFVVVA